METTVTTAAGSRLTPRRLLMALLAVVPVVLLLGLMTPAPASAQDGGEDCVVELTATQDPSVASFSVDGPDDRSVERVIFRANETNDGTADGGEGTSCNQIGNSGREFECQPEDGGSFVSGRYRLAGDEDVCADPRLQFDVTVEFTDEDAEDQEINDVEVANCSDESEGGDESGGDEDSGATPEGGVDSGAGGNSERSTAGGATLPVAGAVLIVLAAGLLVKKVWPTR